jgi:putative effector of murein hydrolase
LTHVYHHPQLPVASLPRGPSLAHAWPTILTHFLCHPVRALISAAGIARATAARRAASASMCVARLTGPFCAPALDACVTPQLPVASLPRGPSPAHAWPTILTHFLCHPVRALISAASFARATAARRAASAPMCVARLTGPFCVPALDACVTPQLPVASLPRGPSLAHAWPTILTHFLCHPVRALISAAAFARATAARRAAEAS